MFDRQELEKMIKHTMGKWRIGPSKKIRCEFRDNENRKCIVSIGEAHTTVNREDELEGNLELMSRSQEVPHECDDSPNCPGYINLQIIKNWKKMKRELSVFLGQLASPRKNIRIDNLRNILDEAEKIKEPDNGE